MKILKTLALILVQLLICFILAETAAYFFLLNSNNALYRARRILQADSQLGWRLQSDLNAKFEKTRVMTDVHGYRTDKVPENYSLLTLGPSSAFGWGVEADETYTARLAQELNLEFLNASQIGYSIAQGVRLWENNLKSNAKPRFALIAYGINDLDKFRFYTTNNESDADFFKESPIQFSSLVRSEKYFNLMTLVSVAANEINLKLNNCSSLSVVRQRVSFDEYEAHLSELIADLQKKGILPVLVNTPYYLKVKNKEYSLLEIEKRYKASMQAASEGKCAEALSLLNKAKQLEPDRIAEDTLRINSIIKRLAEEKKLIVVNAYGLLNTDSIAENYVDPIHPSVQGHKLIARQLADQLKNLK